MIDQKINSLKKELKEKLLARLESLKDAIEREDFMDSDELLEDMRMKVFRFNRTVLKLVEEE
jgi:hypothetical protein